MLWTISSRECAACIDGKKSRGGNSGAFGVGVEGPRDLAASVARVGRTLPSDAFEVVLELAVDFGFTARPLLVNRRTSDRKGGVAVRLQRLKPFSHPSRNRVDCEILGCTVAVGKG
jgi:hypothetical protein